MSELMQTFVSQAVEHIQDGDLTELWALVHEFNAQGELQMIKAEDPELYDEILEILNS